MNKRTTPSRISPSRKRQSAIASRRKPNATDVQIGEAIRAHRLIARMSQGALAEQLGVSFQQVQKYEKGVNRVGAGRLPQIAAVLEIPISAFFNDAADASPGKSLESVAPVALITDSDVLRLLTSFADITDRTTRRCLAELIEGIAAETRKNNRR